MSPGPEGISASFYSKGIGSGGSGTLSPEGGTRAERAALVSFSRCGLQTTSLGSFFKVQTPGRSPKAQTAGLRWWARENGILNRLPGDSEVPRSQRTREKEKWKVE